LESVVHEPAAPGDRATPLRRTLRNPFVWFFLVSAISLPLIRPLLRHEPAPPPVVGRVPAFELVRSDGAPFGSDDLAGRVWVASFLFTRCASICPTLARSMAGLQERYRDWDVDGVHLVSVTVDPEHDTPERLAEYGRAYGQDPARWTMLTGSPDSVHELVVSGFRLAMGPAEADDAGIMDIAHSGRVVLVDGEGKIRGYYESDASGLDEVFHRSLHVLRESAERAGE
jgi:protein SCO1/2